jgi:hypothetical protein
LNPFLNVFEALSFGDVEHINGSGATQRISECILCVADAAGDLPIIDAVYRFFFSEGN